MKINIKPLSVNKCWQWKRFKTKEYKRYELVCLLLLKSHHVEPAEYNTIDLWFYVSSKLADVDNPTKPILDILQKRYKRFNDRQIYDLNLKKRLVEKGKEYIDFTFSIQQLKWQDYK